jgi:iron(III) transport system ATP-binding protein
MTPARHRLELCDVRHAYAGGPEVIQGVSLAVEPGETACLLGPSGCGKTTLLRLAAGLETLQAGSITIGERIVAQGGGVQVPPEARGVGLMFQDYALFPHLTIRANVTFGLAGRPAERLGWVERGLARMGLAEMAESYPHTLSGGQQQRVALLRALAPEPRVMLLDEPFSGLDVALRAQVREDTLGLLKETGVATLMVTHDPEEAMLMADRLLIMNDGRIVQAGRPHDVYAKPASAFVAALFGPVNRLTGRVQGGRVETSLGAFPAPGLADGSAAQVLIRIEGVRAAPPGAEPPGTKCAVTLRVIDARSLGRASILHLAADGLSVQARIPGVFLPAPGQPVAVWTNPAQTFVFPA